MNKEELQSYIYGLITALTILILCQIIHYTIIKPHASIKQLAIKTSYLADIPEFKAKWIADIKTKMAMGR